MCPRWSSQASAQAAVRALTPISESSLALAARSPSTSAFLTGPIASTRVATADRPSR